MKKGWIGNAWVALLLFLSMPAGATEARLTFDTKDVSISIITLGEGKQTYPLPKGYEDKEWCQDDFSEEICDKKESGCEEDISYLLFKPLPDASKDNIAGLTAINARLKAMATSKRCSVKSVMIKLTLEEMYARLPFVSVVLRGLDYCVNCGGSCHGDYSTLTFDTRTGREIKLTDILLQRDHKILTKYILSHLPGPPQALHLTAEQRATLSSTVQPYMADNFWAGGFFIRNGKVYVNTNAFIYSCANGNFYPIEIDDNYIKPEFLDLLKKSR